MTASLDATAIVWDLAAPSRITAPMHTGKVLGITVSPDGSTAASLGGDGQALVWDCGNGDMQASLQVGGIVSACAGACGPAVMTVGYALDRRLLR